MTIDKEAILNLLNDFSFDYEDGMFVFTCEDNTSLRNYLVNIKEFNAFSLNNGASKCVIIPDYEDFVIKLPYTGEWLEAEEEADEDFYYQTFYDGADGWDYCRTEYYHYEDARAEGLDQYLAPTTCIGYLAGTGFPVYVQPKCKIFTHTSISHSPEERNTTKETIKSSGVRKYDLPIDWLTDFRVIYGESELIRFLSFLEKEEWRDLRGDNVGYLNGKPVLVDYSDFWG